MICIECGNHCNSLKKVLCQFCGKKVDKYAQTSDTYKFIDCLLLKDQVLRHLLLNQEINSLRIASAAGWQLLPHLFLYYSGLAISKVSIETVEVDLLIANPIFQMAALGLYILFTHLLLSGIGLRNLAFVICASSFFSFFKVIFVLWEYQDVQFYAALEILNCCSNVCALKCFESDHFKACFAVLISKVASYVLVLYIFQPEVLMSLVRP